MNRRLVIVMLTVLATVGLAVAEEVPFDGIVVQDDVQVRCGAGMRYYVVGSVPKGTKVRVDEVFYGWNKIVPPEGVYSYISKAYVDAKGDGKVGEVTADGQEVKAASLQAPGESWRVQAVLDKGATVQIVDQVGSYYKIEPPKGAYVFLPPGSVQRADQVPPPPPLEVETPVPAAPEQKPAPAAAEQMPLPSISSETPAELVKPQPEAATEPSKPAAEEPASAATEQPKPAAVEAPAKPAATEAPAVLESATEAAPVTAESPSETELVLDSSSLAALEKQTLPLFLEPVDQQPIGKMLAAYQALDQTNMTPDEKRLVATRIAVLKRNEQLAATLKRFQAEKKKMAEETAAAEAKAQTLQRSDYDLVGTLMASAVYSGETLPRLYRVIAGDGRTLGWVKPAHPIDARKDLGKLVGIQGNKQYDDALKLDIYSVTRIDLLEASE